MKESTSTAKDAIGEQLIGYCIQLKKQQTEVCQLCDAPLGVGSPVSVFIYRPAEDTTYKLGHVICGDNEHDLTTHFTIGVHGLIVDGQIGSCTDNPSESSWPVVLNASVRVESPLNTNSGYVATGDLTQQTESLRQWQYGEAVVDRADTTGDNGTNSPCHAVGGQQ